MEREQKTRRTEAAAAAEEEEENEGERLHRESEIQGRKKKPPSEKLRETKCQKQNISARDVRQR